MIVKVLTFTAVIKDAKRIILLKIGTRDFCPFKIYVNLVNADLLLLMNYLPYF